MSSEQTVSQPSKTQRVLACVRCQQRKVKCDRKFPCSHCIKHQVQCVPAALLPRQRRRRFPERVLLDQLRRYEDLLRQHNVAFEPLLQDAAQSKIPRDDADGDKLDEELREGASGSSPSTTKSVYQKAPDYISTKHSNFWHAVRQRYHGDDDDSDDLYEEREVAIKRAMDLFTPDDDQLIFGTRQATFELSTLHPEPAQIFRLWQLFLDNVNPMFRVVHSPTMQSGIIDAMADMASISPTMEALMFGIYSMAIVSVEDEYLATFASSKLDLLKKYQFGCQQALLKCSFLRCSDRDTLTALFLYMLSLAISTRADLRALSSMMGIAIRIAQRMRIDTESGCAESGVLEGEMRRRLWWALVLFDARVSQLGDTETHSLDPTWDCAIPLNVNDADLRPEMKEPPIVHKLPTESIFAVVRCEVDDYVRNTLFHIELNGPLLKPLARSLRSPSTPADKEMIVLEKMIEDKYLSQCDPANPLQFTTIWHTRLYLAKCKLLEDYWKAQRLGTLQTDAQLDDTVAHAVRMLESDTMIMNSSLTKGFRWVAMFYFPFPAYIHLVKDLKKRPLSKHADHAWEAMSNNCEARFLPTFAQKALFLNFFTRHVLHAWWARESIAAQSGETLTPPRIVTKLKNEMGSKVQDLQQSSTEWLNTGTTVDMDDFTMPMPPMNIDNHIDLQRMEALGGMPGFQTETYQDMSGQVPVDLDVSQLNLSAMDWGAGFT